MAKARHGSALQSIRTLFNVGTYGGLTDRQLLERFTASTGEAAELAFAVLIERHGAMVLRVCQSVLREPHDAQDAFQATFLVLVRKAGSIRNRDSLASWLHGVARRIAACAKASTARRRRYEQRAAEKAAVSVDDGERDDLAPVLHEELDRLPEKYRAPIVLFHLEGLTHEQTAQQLRWPVGTVRSRLARGRERLRGRLMRRGLALSIVLWEGVLAAETAKAGFPAALAGVTAEVAARYASGRLAATGIVSASVALLVEGAMNAMIVTKMKFAVLACGLLAAGAVVVGQQAGKVSEEEDRPARAGATGIQTDRSVPFDDAAADDAAVARELGQLDLDLLAEEVQQLRERVEVTLRDKLRAERRTAERADEGPGTQHKGVKEARSAYEAARASYLAKARELRSEQQRLGDAREPRQAGSRRSGGSMPPDDGRLDDRQSAQLGSHAPAAAIGSIDMGTVMKRYEKVQQFSERFKADSRSERERLAMLTAQVDGLVRQMQDAVGVEEQAALEGQVAALKSQIEAERESAEQRYSQREARALAEFFEEIQETTASVAKAKGLNYVVKVAPRPGPDSAPIEVQTALNRSVIYADPRTDLTEEVIRELNRRFKTAAAETPR